MFSPPPFGCGRDLPLGSNDDWLNLVNLWDHATDDITMYMLSINSPLPYHLYEQLLENVQPNLGLNESANNKNPPTYNVSDDDMGSEDHQLGDKEFRGLVNMMKAKAKEWPSRAAEYEDNNGEEEGDRQENEVGDSGDDLSEDSDFNESGEDVDEEGDDVSLTNSDERSEQATHSDLDDLRNPDLDEEIPRLGDGVTWKVKSITGVYQNHPILSVQSYTLVFWTVYNAYTEHLYKRERKVIKKKSVAAYEWLLREPIKNWVRKGGVLEIRRGKDKPRKMKDNGHKRKGWQWGGDQGPAPPHIEEKSLSPMGMGMGMGAEINPQVGMGTRT
ncbi:hypothetical protein Cgig2_001178 [Carnegiea gigantea]|uniref:Uncharacterized protein n=1 Tax=Carnegiea gigantea TaxID=171969 RepID=A0A9Q1JW34_9CARY|nr:hypothetical protein Cgig2_001178 [Carnegiea gigantea]